MKISNVILLVFLFFVVGLSSRVLVPYYKTQHDRSGERASRHEMQTLMSAIELFSEQNPEHRFPTNLAEVAPIILAKGEDITVSNLSAVCDKFVYLQPPSNVTRKVLSDRIVLVEKLGHYKYKEGGYIGRIDHFEVFFPLDEYEKIIKTNGLSLEQLR